MNPAMSLGKYSYMWTRLILPLLLFLVHSSSSCAMMMNNSGRHLVKKVAATSSSSSFIDKLAWIVLQDRRQLAVRSKGKSVFFTPGGKREAGETDVQALMRECREELTVHLAPTTIRPYGVFEATAFGKTPDTVVRMTCYTAEYTGTLQASSEIEEFQWIDSTQDPSSLTESGIMILKDLKAKDLID